MLKSNINSNYAYLKRGYSSDPKMRIQEDIYEESLGHDNPKELSFSDNECETNTMQEPLPNKFQNEMEEAEKLIAPIINLKKNNNYNKTENNYHNINTHNNKNNLSNPNSNYIFNNNNNSNEMKETSNTSYKDLLELKIRNQAKRLCELQDYKNLCEKRLLQVSPGHPLPVEEKHLGISFNNNSVGNSNNNFSFEANNGNLNIGGSENFNKSSYDKEQTKLILDKIAFLENENNFLKQENEKQKNFPVFDLHSINAVTQDKLRQAYLILQNNFQNLQQEKESILNSLREETIANEEQRNFIEMLKKTIEHNIVNEKLFNMLNYQKNTNNYPKKAEIIEVVLDISKLQKQLEQKIKEKSETEFLFNQLRLENEKTKQTNNDLNCKKQKIIESLEKGINELEQAKQKVKNLESEKDEILQQLEKTKEFNDKILADYESVLEKYNDADKNLKEFEVVKSELRIKEKENKKISEELLLLTEEKKTYERKITEMKSEFSKLSLEKTQIDQISEQFIENHKNLKTQFEGLSKNHQEKLHILDLSEESLRKTQKLLTENAQKIGLLSSESEKAQKALCEKAEKIEALLIEKECYVKENQNLQTEILKLNSELSIMQINFSEQNAQMKNLIKENENLNFQAKELRGLLKKMNTDKDSFYAELSAARLEARNESLKAEAEIENLNSLLEKNFKETENLKHEFSKINEKQINKNLLGNNLKENCKKENLILKKNIDELSLQIENFVIELEEKKILLRNLEKDNELLKQERDKFIKFYEKEKFENANNLNFIKLLEEEKIKMQKETDARVATFNPLISQLNSARNSERISKGFTSAKVIEQNLSNLKIGIHSCQGLLEVFMKKYKELVKDNNSGGLFIQQVEKGEGKDEKSSLKEYEEKEKAKSEMKEVKNFEEWFNILSEELKTCLNSIEDFEFSQETLKQAAFPILSHKQTNDLELIENERLIATLQAKTRDLTNSLNELKLKSESLIKEIKSFKNDNKKLYDQNKKFSEKLSEKNNLQKEFNFFESLLTKILIFVQMPEIKNAANNLIDLFDIMSNNEKDKFILEKKLTVLEKEFGLLIAEPSRNEELEAALLKQISNMKNLVKEFERKIFEKKSEIKNIENKFFNGSSCFNSVNEYASKENHFNSISNFGNENANTNNKDEVIGNSYLNNNNYNYINNNARNSKTVNLGSFADNKNSLNQNNYNSISNNNNFNNNSNNNHINNMSTLNYTNTNPNASSIRNMPKQKSSSNNSSLNNSDYYTNNNNPNNNINNNNYNNNSKNFEKPLFENTEEALAFKAENAIINTGFSGYNQNFPIENNTNYNYDYNLNNEENVNENDYNNNNFDNNYNNNSGNLNFNSTEFKENMPREETCGNLKSDFSSSNTNINNLNSFFNSGSILNSSDSPVKANLNNLNKNNNINNNNNYINISEKYNPSNNFIDKNNNNYANSNNNNNNNNQNESRKENSTFTFSQNESQNSEKFERRNLNLLNNNNNNNLNNVNNAVNLNLMRTNQQQQHQNNNLRYNDWNNNSNNILYTNNNRSSTNANTTKVSFNRK